MCADERVELLNSLREKEQYRAYLENIFEKSCVDYSNMCTDTLIPLAARACNGTAGLAKWVFYLVFGVVSRMGAYFMKILWQKEQMIVLRNSRKHKAHLGAYSRFQNALNSKFISASDVDSRASGQALVFCDDSNQWWGHTELWI